jgi:ankyrin repeat protein
MAYFTEFEGAIGRGDYLKVKEMIADGANVTGTNFDGDTLLHKSTEMGDWPITSLLLENGLTAFIDTLNSKEMAPLHCAAFGRNVFLPALPHADYPRIARELMSLGAEVSRKNIDRETPLHIAVEHACPAMVQALLDNGADLISVRETPIGEFTAGQLAITLRRYEIAALIGAETQRRVLVAEHRAQCVAFAMGKHERLGEESLVLSLHPEMVKMILDFV